MAVQTNFTTTEREDLVITRIFAAPRELVFKVWTDPEHLAQWWGPHGFTNPVCQVDLRPGGVLTIVMHGPDGTDYPLHAVFDEVAEPERLVFTARILEDGHGDYAAEIRNTVTFVEEHGKTRLTVQTQVLKAAPSAAEALGGMEEGWNQSLDRLAQHLALQPAV